MATIKFVVLNRDNKEFEYSVENTVNDLRLWLAKEFYQSENYVEIRCVMKTPIRVFGKLTLEPGKIPPSYNDSKFERFGLEGRTIHINIEELKKRNEPLKTRGSWSGGNNGLYVPPGNRERKSEEPKEYVYNADDFPALS